MKSSIPEGEMCDMLHENLPPPILPPISNVGLVGIVSSPPSIEPIQFLPISNEPRTPLGMFQGLPDPSRVPLQQANFTHTFLKSVLTSIDSKDPVVANAMLETLLDVIDLLPKDVVRDEILGLAVTKGQSQQVASRLASCKLIGKIATKFEPYILKSEIVGVVQSLCQDVSGEVRGLICMQLASVARGVGLNTTKSLILPELVDLCSDEEVNVRLAGINTVVQMLPLVDQDDLVTEQKDWFVKFYCTLSKLGLPDSKKSDLGLQMPDLVSEVRSGEYEAECRQQCAYNLPAMVVFVGGPGGYLTHLHTTLLSFVTDPSFPVRNTLALSFHQSFFGRTYNNISSLSDCKNSGRCIINKKTRTSCKSCRLRKCLMVGMSKSGSRYGRRSNWFKIHFLMQNNNNNNNNNINIHNDIATSLSADTSGTTTSKNSIISNSDNHNCHDSSSMENSLGGSSLSMQAIRNMEAWEKFSERPLASFKELSKDNISLLSRPGGIPSLPQGVVIPSQIDITPDPNNLQTEIRLGTPMSVNGDLLLNGDRKDMDIFNVSSPDSHSSDSFVKENGDQPPLPGLMVDSLYQKELLTLYNMPGLGNRFPPYLNAATLASRFFYPYYPNFLSLYSRSQYLDNILNEAKNSQAESTAQDDNKEAPANSTDLQPPLKMLKRNPPSPLAFYLDTSWNKSGSSSSHNSPNSSPKRCWKPSSSPYDNKPILKPVSKTEENSSTYHQSSPIDLSVKQKDLEEDDLLEQKFEKDWKDSDETVTKEEKYKVDFVIDEVTKDKEDSKIEQKIPLDLSGFKT